MDKTIADKLMYIPNDNSQNYPFFELKCLAFQLNKPTNPNTIKDNMNVITYSFQCYI